METVQRIVCLFLGAAVVILAATGCPIHWLLLAVGLMLMGVLTVDQLRSYLDRRSSFPPRDDDTP